MKKIIIFLILTYLLFTINSSATSQDLNASNLENDQVLKFYFIMFILFRVFDISKPFPVSYYDKKFKNSFGVIMDDVCAGLYVVAVLVLYMVITR